MVTRNRWFHLGWLIFMVAMLMQSAPWEGDWGTRDVIAMLIAVGFYLAIILFHGFFLKLEDRLDVGEARFDSKTRKLLPPYKGEE